MKLYNLEIDGQKSRLYAKDKETRQYLREIDQEKKTFVELGELEQLMRDNGCGNLIPKLTGEEPGKKK